MNCPDCKAELAPAASKCRCGWVAFAESAAGPKVPCDGAGCQNYAFSLVGDKNLCVDCATEARRREAEKFCIENGIPTLVKQKAFCRRMAKKPMGAGFEWKDRKSVV